jgi:cbb3-type cytochrome oxidase subunit 3
MSWFPMLFAFLQRNSIVVVMAVFVIVLLQTYWPSNKARIESHGRIPLDDEAQE